MLRVQASDISASGLQHGSPLTPAAIGSVTHDGTLRGCHGPLVFVGCFILSASTVTLERMLLIRKMIITGTTVTWRVKQRNASVVTIFMEVWRLEALRKNNDRRSGGKDVQGVD
jgi:hypothetical protein